METYTDIIINERFVIHVLDNRLPAVQCSQALTDLPDNFRTVRVMSNYLEQLKAP